jgi:hypothetical protein
VLLFGKELASFAPLDEVFSVSYGRGPVESGSIRFTDQVGGCRVATHSPLGISARSCRPSDRRIHFIKMPVEVAFLYSHFIKMPVEVAFLYRSEPITT